MVQLKTVALGALLASTAYAVPPIRVDGADFVDSVTGDRFQMIGVDYQPGGAAGYNPGIGVDPLSDTDQCTRDAILMQRLGVNTVRIYNLDPDIDHTECASIYNAAGIYLLLDVNSPLPNESINRVAPWESYNELYLERVFRVLEAFKSFDNTLGFFSANEVINEESVPEVPQYIRAVTRDIKDYLAVHADREIPVGYSAADVRPLLRDTFAYLSCNLENDTSSNGDFFGLNSYSWCGDSSFELSRFDDLVADFSNTTIPIFFSEYGCNEVQPRLFTEVGTIYGPEMTGVFSGGLVYEFTEEPNNYGLVILNDDGTVSLTEDYENLREQYNQIDLDALTAANSTATSLQPPTCESSLIASNLTNSFDIPARPDGVDDLINNGVSGTFPSGTTSVTTTTANSTIYGPDGNEITGMTLNILDDNQSNLPGNNTSGTEGSERPSTTTSGSSPSATEENAGTKAGVNVGTLALGALLLGLFAQL